MFEFLRRKQQNALTKDSRLLFLLSLLLMIGLLTGCQQNEPGPVIVTEVLMVEGQEIVVTRLVRQTVAITATPAPSNPSQKPVSLDIGYVGGFPEVDPQKVLGKLGGDLVDNVFTALTRFNHQTNRVEGELAESWSVNGRVWTFNLRDDIFWVRPLPQSAETLSAELVRPVTAEDVVAAIQRVCQRVTATPDAFILFLIEGCERVYNLLESTPEDLATIGVQAVDSTTLQFTLTRPASYFLTMTTLWMFTPIPSIEIAAWQEEVPALNWLDVEQLLVSGPFMPSLDSWRTDRVVLRPNPYWPLPRSGNVEIINLNYLDSAENAFQLWQAKSLDVSPLPVERREAFLRESPTRANLLTEQTVFYLGFNFDSPVFREPEVRRAFNAAIDRAVLVERVYGGRAVPMRHLTPPGVLGAPPVDQAGIGYSPDYAGLQLQSSGFRTCRLMPPIRFMVSTLDLSLLQAELIRDMWADELGCETSQIVIEQVEFGTLLANTRGDAGIARPDVWELGWASYYPDAHNWLYDLLHCSDSENRQNRPCSEVDGLMEQATAVLDLDQRISLYRQVENRFFGENGTIPIVPLYVRGTYVLVQNWLTYTPALFGGEHFDTYTIDAILKDLERSR